MLRRHLSPQVAKEPLFDLGGCLPLEPPPRGVVVMGSGVDHAVSGKVMGDVGIRGEILAKGKKEYLHSGKFEAVHDLPYIWGYYPEILCNDGELRKSSEQCIQEVLSRRFNPSSVDRICFACWNFPVSDETTKVVNPYQIEELDIML